MARKSYVPDLPRPLVRALYFEARHQQTPMTRLLATIVEQSLRGGEGWRVMERAEEQAPRTGGNTAGTPCTYSRKR